MRVTDVEHPYNRKENRDETGCCHERQLEDECVTETGKGENVHCLVTIFDLVRINTHFE